MMVIFKFSALQLKAEIRHATRKLHMFFQNISCKTHQIFVRKFDEMNANPISIIFMQNKVQEKYILAKY